MNNKKVSLPAEEVTRRRWRNMMIAAMSGHHISPQQRERLENMRQELGISLQEARSLVDQYRVEGGAITLFGDNLQRIRTFRDIISMLLVDGEIKEKGMRLLKLMAQKLDIDDSMLDAYIQECNAANSEVDDSNESKRMSRRIFRRMVGESAKRQDLLKQFDSLQGQDRRELELSVLQEVVSDSKLDSSESTRTTRHRKAYLDDQRVAKKLMDDGVISEEQIKPFRKKQEDLLQNEGRVVSFITEMVKAGALDRDHVEEVRLTTRKDSSVELENWSITAGEGDDKLVINYQEKTLDFTFCASCLKLSGYLDHNTAEALQGELEKIYAKVNDDKGRLLIFDLSEVSYISSAGVGAILNARATLLERWGDIRLVNVTQDAQEIFNLIGVDQVLTFCDSIEDALWSFTDLASAKEA